MVSVWYVYAAVALGVIGMLGAFWKSGSVFALALAKKPFWIAVYHHRFGTTTFPVFRKESPDLEWLLEHDAQFASEYEGEGAPDREEGEGREDEYLDICGPFFVGLLPFKDGA